MEKAYKVALEIICELCNNYATTTGQIQEICEIVLKQEQEDQK